VTLGRGGRWRRTVRLSRITGLVLAVSLAGAAGQAQSQLQPATPSSHGPALFTPNQLEQLLAPIALYPDPLLSQILTAATYPLEVVQATRWLQDPTHAALTGAALAAALESQRWDPSIKALVPFPQILRMMDSSLDWTEAVGDAFLADHAAVMDAIQRLRQRAQSAGRLVTTAQQTVSTADQAIVVVPADPQLVYVPVYDPRVVYGTWVYTHYPFFGFPPPVIVPFGSPVAAGVSFGVGIVIVEPFWGWHHWDWPHRRLLVDVDRFTRIGGHHPPPGGPTWQHDPRHRHGVPYRDLVTRARFPGLPPGDVRGYGPGPAGPPTPRPGGAAPPPGSAPPKSPGRIAPPRAPGRAGSGVPTAPSPRPGAGVAPAPGAVTPKSPGRVAPPRTFGRALLPPAFESFGRGADIRTHIERARSSRQTIAPPSPPVPAPRPPSGSRSGSPPSGGSGQPRR
jgi:hypothetical protein